MASTMSSRYFRFVADFLASMITENPRFRLSFLNKTRQILYVEQSETCVRHLIPNCKNTLFTPFVLFAKLPVNWPKFTDRTVKLYIPQTNSVVVVGKYRVLLQNNELMFLTVNDPAKPDVRPSKRRFQEKIIAICTNKYRCVAREQIGEFVTRCFSSET